MQSKFTSPLLGYNNNVRHKARVFHIQTEDSGVKHPHIITHLFMDGGRILKSVKKSYAEYIGVDGMTDIVKTMMKEQHKAMFISLRDGQFDHLVDPPAAPKDAAAAPAAPGAAAPAAGSPAAAKDAAAPAAAAVASAAPGAAAAQPSAHASPVAPPVASERSGPAAARSVAPPPRRSRWRPMRRRRSPAPRTNRSRPTARPRSPPRPQRLQQARRSPSTSTLSSAPPRTPRGARRSSRRRPICRLRRRISSATGRPPAAIARSPGSRITRAAVRRQPHRARVPGLRLRVRRRELAPSVVPLVPPVARVPRRRRRAACRRSRPRPTLATLPTRPASIFGAPRPPPATSTSIFGGDLMSDKSLDEVILSYLAEDLELEGKKK